MISRLFHAGSVAALLMATGLGAVACGSSESPAGANTSASSEGAGVDAALPPSLCATDPRAESFTPGMDAAGTTGKLHARLLEMSPSPAAKGNNNWTVQIVDDKGTPIDGAAITIKPFMPDHGHGSSITPQVKPVGSDGKYDVTLLNLFMPGIWQITFSVTTGATTGSVADSVVFTFCVAG